MKALLFDPLAGRDGNVVAERTAGELSARCDKEGADFPAMVTSLGEARRHRLLPTSRVRSELRAKLVAARRATDGLFALLTPKGMAQRPIAERHRFVFYLGHLEAFDWNLVCRDALGHGSVNAGFEQLFAFGIDPIDGGPTDTAADWPTQEHLTPWIRRVRQAVDDALDRAPLTGWLEDAWAARLAVEHRLMHAETLCYLLQRTPLRFKRRGPLPVVTDEAVAGTGVLVPRGKAVLGLARNTAPHVGWDNEYERHTVEVPSFTMARLPVSNGEWLAFVEAGGYRSRALWDEAAWAWLGRDGIEHPAFWRQHDGRWWWQAMFGEVPLPRQWPVYVSHAEATAYAKWKGARLPTEAQWHRAAFSDAEAPRFPWGAASPEPGRHGHFGFARFDPVASGTCPQGDSPLGLADLMGNGWEWTSTVFGPFAGFEALPFYRGYSANFFDGNHFVMKGASASTDLAFLRPSFRNWFQPHYQHVFSKFRLVTDGRGSTHE